ncbi:MAG: hypothetical protein WCC12_19090 [Anaerolineales bacterium]
MNNTADQNTNIFRRRFPLGYLLEHNPFFLNRQHPHGSTSEAACCGQFLFSLGVLQHVYFTAESYLKTGPGGLELYWHGYGGISVGWQEILRLERKQILGLFPYETLYVDRPIFMTKIKPIYLSPGIKEKMEKKRLGIPLRCYMGWPHGELAHELVKYIPQIIGTSG